MSALVVIDGPAVEPVTVAQQKTFMSVELTFTLHDELITGFIIAAREYAEKFLRRSLIKKDYAMYFDCFPNEHNRYMNHHRGFNNFIDYRQQIKLWRPPCIAVDRIEYVDLSGATQTLTPYNADSSPNGFRVDTKSLSPSVIPSPGNFWPGTLAIPNAVAIFYSAGYGEDATAVPFSITLAMKQLAAHWYEHRESVTELNLKEAPQGVDMLLESYRVVDFAPTQG